MKNIITILFLAFCLNGKAQTYIAIPDSNFVHYLKTIVPAAFKGDSLNKTSTLVITTHTINVGSLGISNLYGVQYFTSLTYLRCDANSLTSLPTLSNFLQHLNCGGNQLTSLPVLPNSLQDLNCSSNILTALPALPNSLTFLQCTGNLLTSLPTLPDSLQTLYCSDNSITCFPIFPNTITTIGFVNNPYNCLPNYVLPAMNSFTTTPLCAAGNTNGCMVADIEKYTTNNNISLYPNPNNGSFVIESSSATKQTIQVYDVNGKVVLSQTLNGKTIIDAGSINEGVYNISIISNEGVVNKRLVIVR